MTSSGPIVFFDGTCGFCHAGVRWILRHDRRGNICFAPLQGETYGQLDMPDKPIDMSTMVVLDRGRLYTRSSASIRTLWAIGGVWGAVGGLLWVIPKPLRDLGYRFVAANRYRIATKREVCEIPTADFKARMLS